MAPRKKKVEPWYFKYLRREIRKIWNWSPERKKAKKRALVGQETYRCEECLTPGLTKGMYEVDHIIPCESLTGWDGWTPFIARAIEVKADGIKILCKPCHYKKSAAENAARRAHNDITGRTD